MESLKDHNQDVRRKAVLALGRIGPDAKAATAGLTELLKDNDVRWDACDVLRRIGPAAVPALTTALKDQDENVRSAAAWALGLIGPEAKAAVPALAELIKDDNKDVRRNAFLALKRIGPATMQAFAGLLNDNDFRRAAVSVLGQMGSAAVPALTTAVANKDEEVRRTAAEALGLIGPEAKRAVPALAELLQDTDATVRKAASKH